MTKLQKDRELVRRCIEERWSPMVRLGMKHAGASCPLCVEYGGRDDECGSCPIRIKTGLVQCHGTPYDAWRHHPCVKTARAEMNFLWSLHDELAVKIAAERAKDTYTCNVCHKKDSSVLWASVGVWLCPACRDAKALAEKLNGRSVTIALRADEDQNLYLPVRRAQIANAIYNEHDVDIIFGMIAPETCIKTLGVFDVEVRVSKGTKATVKVWVVQAEDEPTRKSKHSPCVICGAIDADTDIEARVDHGAMVCGACARKCYDADGHYLVPVVRGGPWYFGGKTWERWTSGVPVGHDPAGYRVRDGSIYLGESNLSISARPGIEFRTPRNYDGPLPEGCRWAEGSEPEPAKRKLHKVHEGSHDNEHWTELRMTDDLDETMCSPSPTFKYTRVRIVGEDAPDISPNDRVFVDKPGHDYHGERGIVVTVQKAIDYYRVAFADDVVRGYHAGDLRLEREMTGKADAITTRAAVASLGRIVSDLALTLKRDEFRSIKAEEAFTAYERQAERLLERLDGRS